MKINFNKDANKLYNFLSFPRILFFQGKSGLSYQEEFNNIDFINDSIDNLKTIKSELESYDKEIRKFFNGEFFNHISLFDFIYKEIPIIKFDSRDKLFKKIGSLNDDELRYIVIEKLLSYSDFNNSTIKGDLDTILKDNQASFDFIKNSNLDLDFKWNLTIFMNNPGDYIADYIVLMEKLYPIFEKYYNPYESRLIKVGEKIKSLIDEKGMAILPSLFNQVISEDIFDHADSVNLFVSFIFSESIVISDHVRLLDEDNSRNLDLVIGMNTIEAFKLIKKDQKNKKLNRINIFKSLGDETRYEVLVKIAQGVSPNKEIARQLGISGATVSYHISSFVENGLLSVKRVDNKLTHVVNYEVLEQAIEGLKKDIDIKKDSL